MLAAPESEIQRAAAIQAFEFDFELAWKLLQSRLRDDGLTLATPRTVFRAAGDAEFIDDVERLAPSWAPKAGSENEAGARAGAMRHALRALRCRE